jgi:radical SAM protein with 4Fe4S-binding SPASM domain
VLVEADGAVYPCCRCPVPMGDLRQASFRAIWQSAEYARFRAQGLSLSRRGSPVQGCDCYSCVHHTANLRVYQALHPVSGRGKEVRALSREFGARGED